MLLLSRILEDDAVPMSFLPPRHGDRGDHEEFIGYFITAEVMSLMSTYLNRMLHSWSIVSRT